MSKKLTPKNNYFLDICINYLKLHCTYGSCNDKMFLCKLVILLEILFQLVPNEIQQSLQLPKPESTGNNCSNWIIKSEWAPDSTVVLYKIEKKVVLTEVGKFSHTPANYRPMRLSGITLIGFGGKKKSRMGRIWNKPRRGSNRGAI